MKNALVENGEADDARGRGSRSDSSGTNADCRRLADGLETWPGWVSGTPDLN
jgi:hypothetical protein